jgi:hypothetical protein
MVPLLFSHKRYLRFVRGQAGQFGGLRTDHRHYQVWRKLQATNLDLAYPLLAGLYCRDRGRPARCPVCLLRSCLAMMLCGETSFDEWVALMRDDPFYALISGFAPDDVPGVGTFYEFQDRLLHRPRQGRTRLQRPHYQREQRDKAAAQQDKNDLRPHQDIVNRLAQRLLARPEGTPSLAAVLAGYGDFSALPVWERTLHALFFSCFVARSVDLKLIDLNQLHVAGDGSKLPTWANPYGRKRCLCDNRDKTAPEHCRCHRAYRDPLARWGWDSYRHCWVYGHTLYELTAYSFKHTCQLPVLVSLADCNRHDSVHGLVCLHRAQDLFGLPLQTASLDKAHDTLAFHRLGYERWQMALVIPLNQRNQGNLTYAGPLRLDEGVPICLADKPMTRAGFCPDRMRIKWRCPLAASKKQPPLSSCPHFGQACSGSTYGRVIYTYPQQNYRHHPLIPRDSPLWQTHRDARSCAERSVKRKKYDFHLLQTKTAGRDRWFFRLILAACCQHIDAWLTHAADRLD